jgi:hypothetical protein
MNNEPKRIDITERMNAKLQRSIDRTIANPSSYKMDELWINSLKEQMKLTHTAVDCTETEAWLNDNYP